MKNYNTDGVINALIENSNSLVWVRGNANRTNRFLGLIYTYEDGHAWLIDGAKKIQNDNSIINYVHCNWGWNSHCDGYFISGIFNTKIGPLDKDTIDKGGTDEHNFRYKNKYAILKK